MRNIFCAFSFIIFTLVFLLNCADGRSLNSSDTIFATEAGIISQPVIDYDSNLYAIGADLAVYKYGINGNLLWIFNALKIYPSEPGLLLTQNRFVCLADSGDKVIALSPNGQLLWTTKLESAAISHIVKTQDDHIVLARCISDMAISVVCIDLDGVVLWEKNVSPANPLYASLIASPNGIVYLSALPNILCGLDSEGNQVTWASIESKSSECVFNLIAENTLGQLIAITSNGEVICLSKTGEVLWHCSNYRADFLRPPVLLKDNTLVVSFKSESDNSKIMLCALKYDGTILWRREFDEIAPNPAIGSLKISNDSIAFLLGDGKVALIAQGGKVTGYYRFHLEEAEEVWANMNVGKNDQLVLFTRQKAAGGRLHVIQVK